jgi:hypothetical protein
MKIPKKIKIGGTEYRVKEKRLINWNSNISGQIRYGSNTLILKKSASERAEQDSFFHEIAHGILREMAYNYPKITKFQNDEDFVQELGLVLRKTFLDLLSKNKEEK